MAFTSSLEELVCRNDNGLLGAHSSWRRVRVKDVATVLNGYAFPSSRFSTTEGLPLLRIRDVVRGRTETFFDGAYDTGYVTEPGELVVGMDGDFNSALWQGPPALLNQRVCKVTIDPARYDLRFLSYALPGYLSAINAETSSITVKHLSSRTVEDIPLPLPPLSEQHRIVAAIEEQFTRLDAAVAGLKRTQANLKRYRAAVLAAACSGQLVPTEAELAAREGRSYEPADQLLQRILQERRERWEADQVAKMQAQGKAPKNDGWKSKYKEPTTVGYKLSDLPTGWTSATIDQLAADELNAITDGPFGSNLKTEHYRPNGPRVIRLQNIGDGSFVDAKAHISEDHYRSLAKHRVVEGDLVIAALGETLPRACVIPSWLGPAIVKADCVRFSPNAGLAAVSYLNAAVNDESTRKRTESMIHGVGRPRLNSKGIRAVTLPIPPRIEQERIVAEVHRRFSVIEQLEQTTEHALARAERLRQSVLRRAFEGKLVPQDPTDESADVLLERIREERGAMKANGSTKRVRARKTTDQQRLFDLNEVGENS